MAKAKTPRFYFSLRSPYSWLAHRELVGAHPALADQLEWLPYWEPDDETHRLLVQLGGELPYAEMPRSKHLYILQDVGRLAKSRGLTVSWPVDKDPVWEIPHLGYLVAERAGLGRAYVAAVYRARWQEGRNVCLRDTIGEIGAVLGGDAVEYANASDDPELRAQGARLLLESCRDGVFGVPFFVHRFTRYWGLDRLEEFVEHVRAQLRPEESLPEELAAAAPAYDNGHAGGCG